MSSNKATASNTGAPAAPAGSSDAIVADNLGNSLMQVYQSMTGREDAGASGKWEGPGQPLSSLSIPPLPKEYAEMPPPSAQAPTSSNYPSAADPLSSSMTTITSSGRISRKRTRDPLMQEDDGDTKSSGGEKGTSGGSRSSKSARGSSKSDKESKDGRWAKRFTWPEELHRDFVAAVFDVGLKHSSPSSLLDQMPRHEQITTERIKSHLQKYRLHRVKSKKEFLACYESSMKQFNASRGPKPNAKLNGGQVPAALAYATLHNLPPPQDESKVSPPKSSGDQVHVVEQTTKEPQQETLLLPRLTEAEKKSPVGVSMGYLMGLFFSLKQQLAEQRAAEKANRATTTVAAPVASKAPAPTTSSSGYETFALAPGQHAPHPSQLSSSEAVHPGAAAQSSSVVDPLVAAAASGAPTSTTATNPSTRTNLEENTIMKREMQSQMMFQNKMRALKQQELEKYKGPSHAAFSSEMAHEQADESDMMTDGHEAQHEQGAGESADTPNGAAENIQQRPRSLSNALAIGTPEDFWHSTDMVDDQLFEFLMSGT